MNRTTLSMVLQILELLRSTRDTNIDHITICAGTNSETIVLYNPYQNGGEWEFIPAADTTTYDAFTNIDDAALRMVSDCNQHIREE